MYDGFYMCVMYNDIKNCILKKYLKIDVLFVWYMGKVDWLKNIMINKFKYFK